MKLALALALAAGPSAAQIPMELRAPAERASLPTLGSGLSAYRSGVLATLQFPLRNGLFPLTNPLISGSLTGIRGAPAPVLASAFAHEARAQGVFAAQPMAQARTPLAVAAAFGTLPAARKMLAPVQSLLAQAAPALKTMPTGELHAFGASLSATLQGSQSLAARAELPGGAAYGLLKGSFQAARTARVLRLSRSENLSAPEPPRPEPFRAEAARAFKTAFAVAILDWVTKLAAHGLRRLHWINELDSHRILNMAQWRLMTIMLVVVLPASVLIPWLIQNLGRTYDLRGGLYAGLRRATGLFAWAIGLMAGGALANTVEGTIFGTVTNPFIFRDMAFNLADQALFMGWALAAQLSVYGYRFYSWAKEGAKTSHPFGWPAILAASLGSVILSYTLGPLISNQDTLKGISAWEFLVSTPELLPQLVCAALVSWIPGYLIRRHAREWIVGRD